MLHKVYTTYTNLRQHDQYKWSATITEKAAYGNSTASILAVVKRPSQFRWEVLGNGAAAYTGMYVGEEIIDSDGKNVFDYRPSLKQYTKTPIEASVVTPMGSVAAFIDRIDTFFPQFHGLAPTGARLRKEETILSGGLPVPCYVIEITTQFQNSFTWWVDEKRNVVLREVFQLRPSGQPPLTRRTEFSFVQIGGTLDEHSFVFSPPISTKEVEAFNSAPRKPS